MEAEVNCIFIVLLAASLPLDTCAQLLCQERNGITGINTSFEFTLVGNKNQTGHWVTQFELNKDSMEMPTNWRANFKQSITQYGGVNSLRIRGAFIVPPSRPKDYESFPGIGYYKFHHGAKKTFADASSTCTNEGGHLAIINSEKEHEVIKSVYARNIKEAGPWSFIGFYDRNKSREFVTIFGEPLSTAGFNRWHQGEPNNIGGNQFCGCVISDGLLADVACEDKLSFFCEYDYSWSDL